MADDADQRAPTEAVHVGPMPAGHRREPGCWCAPIRSRLGLVDVWIHRLDEAAALPPPRPG